MFRSLLGCHDIILMVPIDEVKEKNKACTYNSIYFVARGLPSNWEIKSITAKPDGQLEVYDYLGMKTVEVIETKETTHLHIESWVSY